VAPVFIEELEERDLSDTARILRRDLEGTDETLDDLL
jgi:hypothetical protein